MKYQWMRLGVKQFPISRTYSPLSTIYFLVQVSSWHFGCFSQVCRGAGDFSGVFNVRVTWKATTFKRFRYKPICRTTRIARTWGSVRIPLITRARTSHTSHVHQPGSGPHLSPALMCGLQPYINPVVAPLELSPALTVYSTTFTLSKGSISQT